MPDTGSDRQTLRDSDIDADMNKVFKVMQRGAGVFGGEATAVGGIFDPFVG